MAQKARVFVPDQHLRPTEVWHSSLMGQFLSHKYVVNTAPGVNFTTLHFPHSLQIGQKARVFVHDTHFQNTEV